MVTRSLEKAFTSKDMLFSQKNTSAGLLGSFVLLLSVTTSSATIDPDLLPRFLALTAFLIVVLVITQLKGLRSQLNFDSGIIYKAVFPLFLGYIIYSAISVYYSINRVDGVFEVLKNCLFLIFLLISVMLMGKGQEIGKNQDIIVKFTAVAAFVIAAVGLYQYYNLLQEGKNNTEALSEIRSTLGNKNLVSSILFLSLPFLISGIGLFKKHWRLFSLLTIDLALVLIVFLQSRAVWMAVGISLLTSILLLVIFSKKLEVRKWVNGLKRKQIIYGTIFLLIANTFLLPFFINGWFDSSLQSRGESIFSAQNLDIESFRELPEPGSIGTRLIFWNKTIQMIKDHPILGVGPANWKIEIPRYGLDDLGHYVNSGLRHYQQPHNDFLWVMAETGIIGFIFYIALFVFVYKYLFRLITSSPHVRDRRMALLIFFGITGYLVVSFFDFPKERIMHNVLLMLLFAFTISMYNNRFPAKKEYSPPFIKIILICCFAVLAFALYVGIARTKSEVEAKKVITAHALQDWNRLLHHIEKANTSWYHIDPIATPLSWYKGVANFSLNNMEAAFADFKEAYSVHPNHIHCLNNLASCYELKGDHENAIAFYKKALQISPRFEESLINLSAVYYNLGKYEDAYSTISKCDTNTANPKYKTFLTTILSGMATEMALNSKNKELVNQLNLLSLDDTRLIKANQAALREQEDITAQLIKEAKIGLTQEATNPLENPSDQK